MLLLKETIRRLVACAAGFCFSFGVLAASDLEIRYAKNFEIEELGTHRILSVSNTFRGSGKTHRYALVPRDGELPDLPDDILVIRTPVRRVIAMETVYIGYLEALNKLNGIIAAATAEYISNPQVRQKVEDKKIQSLHSGPAVNIERLLILKPDLILSTTTGDAGASLPNQLERSGLPLVLTADYMERHPLARAEWIKFIAAFFEASDEADRIFAAVEERYLELSRLTDELKEKPTVLCGAPYSGVWHVPGGDSFTAKLISDAGGNYLWKEDGTQGGIPLDTERVFLKAAYADYWINPSFYESMSALLSADKRFGKFEAAKEGKVYNNTAQVSEQGGNAIWEEGIVHPEIVLADLIRIFHPDVLPDHKPVFYEHLK